MSAVRSAMKDRAPNRRRSDRLEHEVPVAYRSAGAFVSDWATSISQGGLFINTRTPLPVGSVVKLIFQLPGAPAPFDMTGRVTRVVAAGGDGRAAPGMGIEFTGSHRARLEEIEKLVETLRRELR